MFSFHKPKIYRSTLGCCICKAKSSSSRFTDSKKYEPEFENCFRIKDKRSGEICNACVLLVKRWKKLSPENRLVKHWHHVVDARAGPGTKLGTNRRLLGNNSNSNNQSSSNNDSFGQRQRNGNGENSNRPDILPLSSSQSGNQVGCSNSTSSSSTSTAATTSLGNGNSNISGRRKNQLFSKALAIDTNVSTFTFGEPRRKNHVESYNPYATTHTYASYLATNNNNNSNSNSFAMSSSSSMPFGFTKPQSALSSSAFESVMKRFRQRQQQQQEKAQRRQASKNNNKNSNSNTNSTTTTANNNNNNNNNNNRRLNTTSSDTYSKMTANSSSSPSTSMVAAAAPLATQNNMMQQDKKQQAAQQLKQLQSLEAMRTAIGHDHNQVLKVQNVHFGSSSPMQPATNVKRHHETCSEGASQDNAKITSLLDMSMWKRERTCCGIIFRGPNNEIAIVPQLFKPCKHRSHGDDNTLESSLNDNAHERVTVEADEDEPLPEGRTIKSNSISSCDSNTSGTGSMEQANFESSNLITGLPHPTLATGSRRETESATAGSLGRRPAAKQGQTIHDSPSMADKNQAPTGTSNRRIATSSSSSSSVNKQTPRTLPSIIATRGQAKRGRPSKQRLLMEQQQQEQQQQQQLLPEQQIQELQSPSDTSSSQSFSSIVYASSAAMILNKCEQNVDQEEGEEAEIDEEEDDDEDLACDVDDEEETNSRYMGAEDEEEDVGEAASSEISDLALNSGSSLIVDEEETQDSKTDGSLSIDSSLLGQKAAQVGR